MTSMPASRSALATTLEHVVPVSPAWRHRPDASCATVPAAPFGVARRPALAAGPHWEDITPVEPRAETPSRRTTASDPPRPGPAAARPARCRSGPAATRRAGRLPAAKAARPASCPAQPAGPRLDRRRRPVAGSHRGRGRAVLTRDGHPGAPWVGSRPCRALPDARSPRSPARPARLWSSTAAAAGLRAFLAPPGGPGAGGRQRVRPPLRRPALGPHRRPGQQPPRRPGGPSPAAPGHALVRGRRPVRQPGAGPALVRSGRPSLARGMG